MVYLLKHVEEHGRAEVSEKWSIRQMGVYHRSARSSGETFIILNPSASLQHRLKSISERPIIPSPWELQATILSCTMENWRRYVSDIESRCLHMVIPWMLQAAYLLTL